MIYLSRIALLTMQMSVRGEEGDHLSEIHLPQPTYPQCLGPGILASATHFVLYLASSFHSEDKISPLVSLVDRQGGIIKQGIEGTKGRK